MSGTKNAIDAMAATVAKTNAVTWTDTVAAAVGMDTSLAPISHLPLGALPRVKLGLDSGDLDDSTSQVISGELPAAGSDLVLKQLIGEGGMGQVHLASQRSLGREVAIKMLHKKHADQRMVDMLLHEGRVMGALEHPNIVPIHSLGVDSRGLPVLVMKKVEGVSWGMLLHHPDHPAWQPWLLRHQDHRTAHIEILVSVCNALKLAHARGVIHRDIKPENIMLGEFGEVYLLDWGIAYARKFSVEQAADPGTELTPQIVGTPAYMAPEMVEGLVNLVDERTDVYLLGATLHEALTGHPPHRGTTVQKIMRSAYKSDPIDYGPEIPKELAALCNHAMQRAMSDRPQSVEAFQATLARYLLHRNSIALTQRARQSLVELREVLEKGASRQVGLLEATSLTTLTEARFAVQQALREWPENLDAATTRNEVLGLLAEREIANKNPTAARAFLGEMLTPPESLQRELERLDAELADLLIRNERMQLIEREMDMATTAKPRLLFIMSIGMAMVAVTLGVNLLLKDSWQPLPLKTEMAVFAIMFLVLGAGFFVFRKQFLSNDANRRFSLLVVMLWVGYFMCDCCSLYLGLSDTQAATFSQLVVTMLFATTILLNRTFGWIAAALALSTVACLFLPALQGIIKPLSFLVVIALTTWLAKSGGLGIALPQVNKQAT